MNDFNLTTVPFVNKKYNEYIMNKHKYPMMFNPYNKAEIKDYSPTLSTQCGSVTSSATVLISEIVWKDFLDKV